MAKEKVLPLSHRLYYDPVYVVLARTIRYATMPCEDLRQKLAAAEQEFGIPKLDQAARELLDYAHEGTTLVAKLKPQVRTHCFGLLGPPPEDAAAFYRNTDGSWPANTPPEVREQAENGTKRTKKKEEEPLVLPMSPEEELQKRIPRRAAGPKPTQDEDATPQEARVRDLSVQQLGEQLHAARQRLCHNGPRSFLGKEARKEVALLEAEIVRRGSDIPETPPEPVKRKRGA
jgi:hypothetical protein